MRRIFYHRKIILIFAVLVLLATTGAMCGGSAPPEDITLNYWRVYDDQDDFAQIIAAYQTAHPYITINYRKLRYDEYEQALIDAWAAGKGPDMLTIHNTWVNKYQYKELIEPLPPTTTVTDIVQKSSLGGCKKDTVVTPRQETSITPSRLKSQFVSTVHEDVVIEDQIYGLPMSMDTLALFVNRELLHQAGYPTPPNTWDLFVKTIPELTKQDSETGLIIQSGAALGTADNIVRSTDILSLLMMQNGTQMTAGDKQVITFNAPKADNPEMIPGEYALTWYTSFASPTKEVYTWNNEFADNSLDAFINGKVAYFFGYSYHLAQIEASSVDYEIVEVPQVDPDHKINFSNYWVETVYKDSPYVNEAWNFIQYATTTAEMNSTFLASTERVPAQTQLLTAYFEEDNILSPFAQQSLTAQNWYHCYQANRTEEIFKDMINFVIEGEFDSEEAIQWARTQVQATCSTE